MPDPGLKHPAATVPVCWSPLPSGIFQQRQTRDALRQARGSGWWDHSLIFTSIGGTGSIGATVVLGDLGAGELVVGSHGLDDRFEESCGWFIGECPAVTRLHRPATSRTFSSSELAEAQRRLVPIQVLPTSPSDALNKIVGGARLAIGEVADLLGIGKRTVYNCLAGKKVAPATEARILRLAEVLAPLLDSRDAPLARSWLLTGAPAPADLVRSEQWLDLELAVATATRKLVPSEGELPDLPTDSESRSSAVRAAVLRAFATPGTSVSRRTSTWQPREETGIAPSLDEAQEDEE